MKLAFSILISILISFNSFAAGEVEKPMKVDWSFNGFFGKFDRAQLQRGYQVYKEVCASCHSMKYLSYRNLGETGGPEFSDAEVKAIAAGFTVEDGPNEDGEMFERAGLPKDKFISPYPNEKAARAVNGGAYPPDMSVLVKARSGGANYIYSILMGYENPPSDMKIEEGVYYNKYMAGKKIRMAAPLVDDSVEYSDGTNATVEQMSKDVTTFLMWAAEPHLEARHRMGFKAIVYLIILTTLVYFSMKRIWSRIKTEV